MGRLPLLLTPLLLLPAFAPADELSPESNTVDSVTVYLDRAEITRRVELSLPAGAHTVLIPNLPAQLFEASLRASGRGPAGLSIATVETRREFGEKVATEQERRLRQQLQGLNDQKDKLLGQRQALDTQAKFIERLATLPNEPDDSGNRGLAPEKWAAAWEAIGKGMAETNLARVTLQQQQRELDEKIRKVEQELRQIQTGRRDTLTAAIQVEAKQPGKAIFDLSYQLGNASWSPIYDAVLDTETGVLTLTQAAHVRQSSGESWEKAKVTVSTARPSAGATMPDLHPWWIDFQQPPKPALHESRTKTLQADEMLAGAMAPEGEPAKMGQAQILTSDFSARYVIPGRVTVPADNSKHRFMLNRQTLQAELQARSAPRLDRRAFLYAELDYQGEAPLLPGLWQLQRDGTFVGSQHNPTLRPGETIALAFGADNAIAIDYQQLSDERGKQGLINREQNVQRSYRISITSHHTRKLPVSIFDQLPVSRDERIKVSLNKESSPPSVQDVNNRPGVLEWTRTLEPNEGWSIDFGYQVSYPQDEKVPGF